MRALVIDDHPLVHEIIPAVLRKALGEVAVTTEITLEAGLARAGGAAQPDLVLLDLGLPGCEGLEAVSRFRAKFPNVPLVVLSGTCDRASIIGAFDAGAIGYIPKTSKPDVMIAALKLVAAGGTYVPREALEGRMERPDLDLTQRQREVLRLILKGYNNERIAKELGISPATVKQHAHAIFTALGVSTRAGAVIAAARLGLALG
jgi:two-component system, NarL family, nitrate/nitrite response regulator NarL